jgi:hypothetical protein
MKETVSMFLIEAAAIIVAWGVIVFITYRKPAAATPEAERKRRANARGLAGLTGMATMVLLGILYAHQTNGAFYLTTMLGLGCFLGLAADWVMRRGMPPIVESPNERLTEAEGGASNAMTQASMSKKFPTLVFASMNVTLVLTCIWYLKHGRLGPRMMMMIGIFAFVVMNSVGLVAWWRWGK